MAIATVTAVHAMIFFSLIRFSCASLEFDAFLREFAA